MSSIIKGKRTIKDTKICPLCGHAIGRSDIFCGACGARIITEDLEVNVTGANVEDVQKVAESLVNKISASKSPWLSGSFYLATVVIIMTLFLFVARNVNIIILPIAIIGALLTITIVGAFQLRQDRALSEKNFLTLMFLAFKKFSYIKNTKRITKRK